MNARPIRVVVWAVVTDGAIVREALSTPGVITTTMTTVNGKTK